jgi:hypothetical protein
MLGFTDKEITEFELNEFRKELVFQEVQCSHDKDLVGVCCKRWIRNDSLDFFSRL